MISLDITEHPIGFVKSHDELEVEVSKHFEILERVRLTRVGCVVIFAKSHEF
jgi:hypothetical protein